MHRSYGIKNDFEMPKKKREKRMTLILVEFHQQNLKEDILLMSTMREIIVEKR